MKTLIRFVLLFAITTSATAQTIRGKVTDMNQNPVETAVIVLQTLDSVFVNSAYTDSMGIFNIQSDLTDFRLLVQHLNYQTHQQVFSTNQVGTILLTEVDNVLSEVVIKGERPLVKVEEGRMTYDIPRLLDGKAISNAYESLLQLPGIREQEGKLVLAGSNSLSVILNGKATTMTNDQLIGLLKNTPKERIEKVEIMYSAPPQYHIRGGAVNIILKKEWTDQNRWQGQIHAGYTQKYYDSYSTGATLLYTSPKFSTDFQYAIDQSHSREGVDLCARHTYNQQIHEIDQHSMGNQKSINHQLRLGTDYHINEKNKIRSSYTTQLTPQSKTLQLSNGSFSNTVNQKNNEKPIQMHNLGLNYQSGFGMDAGIDYTLYKNHTKQDLEEKYTGKETRFQSISKQEIKRISAYVDQKQKLNETSTLLLGAKYIAATDRSSQNYESAESQDLTHLNSHHKTKEYTYNLYTGLETHIREKISLSISLAGEYYKHGDFSEWSLFPQLQATYMHTPASVWQLSVASNKEYPSYWEMQGNIGYLNGYMEVHGNPSLKPFKDYSTQLTYILKSRYTITAFWQYSDDYFVQLPYQSSNKLALIYKTTNFDYKQQWGITTSIPFRLGKVVDSRLTLLAFYDKVKHSQFHDLAFTNEHFSLYTQINNSITLSSKPNIKLELNGQYISNSIQGPMTIHHLWSIDAGLKYTFARNQAELSLKCVDLFNTWSPKVTEKFSTQHLSMTMIPDSRALMLSFSYKLGGYKTKEQKEVDASRFGTK